MSDETPQPHACWRMYENMPDLCDAPILAAAFLYAAEQDWIPDDLVGGFAPEVRNAIEKLRARRIFLRLARAPEQPDQATTLSVLEAVPDKWLIYTAAKQLLLNLELRMGNGEGLSEKDRERHARIVRRAGD